MMLSTGKRGDPIGILRPSGTIIRLVDKNEIDKVKQTDPYDLINDKDLKKYKKKMPSSDHKKLKKMLLSKEEPEDEEDYLMSMYKDLKPELTEKLKTEMVFHNETLMLLPRPKKHTFIYVCGATGSGKSYWISEFLKKYIEIYKEKEIYLFSDTSEDEVLDKYNPTRIMINDSIVKKPIQTKELENSLVIMDDVDSIGDKNQKKAIVTLYDQVLKRGRHDKVDMIITNHACTDYTATRNILVNSQFIVCFPSSGATASLIRLFKAYLGLSKEQIDRILKLPSRYVCIHVQYPQFVLYSSGVYLLANN